MSEIVGVIGAGRMGLPIIGHLVKAGFKTLASDIDLEKKAEVERRGATWQPVFENQASTSIGDIAVAPSNPEIVWVGTGEANLFRASMAGVGGNEIMGAASRSHRGASRTTGYFAGLAAPYVRPPGRGFVAGRRCHSRARSSHQAGS